MLLLYELSNWRLYVWCECTRAYVHTRMDGWIEGQIDRHAYSYVLLQSLGKVMGMSRRHSSTHGARQCCL